MVVVTNATPGLSKKEAFILGASATSIYLNLHSWHSNDNSDHSSHATSISKGAESVSTTGNMNLGDGRLRVRELDKYQKPTGAYTVYRADGSVQKSVKKDGTIMRYDHNGRLTAIEADHQVLLFKDGQPQFFFKLNSNGNEVFAEIDSKGNVESFRKTQKSTSNATVQKVTFTNGQVIVRNSAYAILPTEDKNVVNTKDPKFHITKGTVYLPHQTWRLPESYYKSPYFSSDLVTPILLRGHQQITDEKTKAQIARQVGEQMELLRTGNQLTSEQALTRPDFLYIVTAHGSNLNKTECTVGPGDILVLSSPTRSDDLETISFKIQSSQSGNCVAGKQNVSFDISEVQEMLNDFSADVEAAQAEACLSAAKRNLIAYPIKIISDGNVNASVIEIQNDVAGLLKSTKQ